tara:strand:+ start:24 stop:1064 length:1041 start_codon:yes stop_codon:yes gene_type:complete
MNYNKACGLLKINNNLTKYNKKDLKKAYFKQALLFHPDRHCKNNANNNTTINNGININDSNYNNKFKEIKEAYDYLLSYYNYIDETKSQASTGSKNGFENENYKETENTMDQTKDNDYSNYMEMMETFINLVNPKGKMFNNKLFINSTFNSIINNCNDLSLRVFQKLNKEKAIDIYEFLLEHKEMFNITDDLFIRMKQIIQEKMENDNIILLTPDINDLLDDNIYKLEIVNETLYIPLWHHELYFDVSNNDLIVRCEPELSQSMFIDANNNLYYNVIKNIKDVMKVDEFDVNIGKKKFIVKVSSLKITDKEQTYIIRNQGILKINENHMYSTNKRADIILKIKLFL